MPSTVSVSEKTPAQFRPLDKQFVVQALAVLLLLCLELLLSGNVSGVGWNEVDVLPLAKQFADPSWLSNDWYLNQPASYRVLFQLLVGNLVTAWGFLATSIVGRFLCYCLFAGGVAYLARQLGLNTLFLLLAVSLFLYGGCDELFDNCGFRQGAVAGEWWIGGLEAKALAYSLMPLVIGLMLAQHYRWMAALLGIATSFHVLAGGWMFLAVLGWLVLNRQIDLRQPGYWGMVGLLYGVGSMFAYPAILNQLLFPAPDAPFAPSAIYVFLRLPHHLNPLSWSPEVWIRPVILLILFALSVVLIRRKQRSSSPAGSLTFDQDSSLDSSSDKACLGLAQLVGISLIPFGLGLLLAWFDRQGQFLQYYPFRLADVLLPFATCLLLSKVLQQSFSGKQQKIAVFLTILVLSLVFITRTLSFVNQVAALPQFPGDTHEVDAKQEELYQWIRNNTSADARIISPPVEMISFTWLAERATIAKFKFLPQTKAGILAWVERLSDLAGGNSDWARVSRTEDRREEIQDQLTEGYNRLTAAQVLALMERYDAPYFVTIRKHRLDLPVVYRNSDYVLYAKPDAA